MRPVRKTPADAGIAIRHTNPPSTSKEARDAWNGFYGQNKHQTKARCLEEQLGLCAYSEIPLSDSELGMHLDHIEPRSVNPGRTFDHSNLLLSAIDDAKTRSLAKQDVFGGHYRGNKYSATGFIHPLQPNCRDYFHYAASGKIMPNVSLPRREQAKARLTIYLLNLNAPLLIGRRQHWINELNRQIDSLLDSPEALDHFAKGYLCPEHGRLQQFLSASCEQFGTLGDRVIAAHCPDC